MGRFEIIKSWYPKGKEVRQYVRPVIPPLDVSRLGLACLIGEERRAIRTPTTGSVSLLLSYKNREGAISSFEFTDSDMELLQLQGARSAKAFRVASGVRWAELMADEAVVMALEGNTGIRRLTMPHVAMIQGIEHAVASEGASDRYMNFVFRAKLRWSQEERLFARDIK